MSESAVNAESEFNGKVAIVTGAGGGIGRCHAVEFAKRGAKVVVNDLGGSVDGTGAGDAADAVVAEIAGFGGTAIANKASVADRDGAKSIAEDAIAAFGRIDILVNNAGILRDRTFKNMTLDEFDLVMQVHLTGTAYVTHAVWPHMYEQRYGRIVFTSSGSGIFGNFGQSNYGAAKMGMLGLANVLALEGANRNVRVNCLGPGAATRMTNTVPGRDEDLSEPDPLRHPALVSPAVLFMCSENAPNGAVIHASGGNYSRSEVWVNDAVELGAGATYEDLLPHVDELLDMSNAHPRQPRTPPVLREIRTENHQSWTSLRKAVRALMDQPHEPFGTPKVAAKAKSTVRRMQEKTGLPLERLKDMLDSM